MLARKEINQQINKALEDDNLELVKVLDDYIRLKYTYIPQLLKHFVPSSGGLFFPHMSKPIPNTDLELYPKGFVDYLCTERIGVSMELLVSEFKSNT